MEKKRAFICIYGNGETGLNTVRSLGRDGIPVTVIGIKGNLNLASYSKYCSRFETIDSFEKKQLLDKLFQLRKELDYKPVLFFDNDYMLALLNDSEDLLKEFFLLTQGIKDYSFKEFQMKSANEAGIDVPKTWRPKTWLELERISSFTKLKLIAKPSQDSEKKPFKVIIANNSVKLSSLLKNKISSVEKIIVQEYIEGNQTNVWVSLGYRSLNAGFSSIVTGFKYVMYPSTGGLLAIGKLSNSDEVRVLTKKIIKKMNYFGIFGVEFKYSKKNNKYYFIEISPRTESFHNMSLLGNLDLPLVAYYDLVYDKNISIQTGENGQGYWISFKYFVESIIIKKNLKDIYKIFVALLSKNKFQHFDLKDLKPFVKAMSCYFILWNKRILKKIWW